MKKMTLWIILAGIISTILTGCGGSGKSNGSLPLLPKQTFETYAVNDPLGSSWASWDGSSYASTGPVITTDGANMVLSLGSLSSGAYFNGTGSSGWTNYSLRFLVKMGDTDADCIFDIYFRTLLHQTGYFLRISNQQLILAKKQAGTQYPSIVDGWPVVNYTIGSYYPVRIDVNGDLIRVYFNNSTTPDLEVTDNSSWPGDFLPAGTIGFDVESGWVYIDDVEVTRL